MLFSVVQQRSHKVNLLFLTLLLAGVLGVFLVTELNITGGRLGVPLDDAWIHYQFARNLANGEGFSYNPGEPTPGSTAPLWTLILAGVGLVTSDFLVPSLILSAGFLLAVVWLAYGFTMELSGGRALWGVLAGVCVILSGRLLWAGLAGMETTAFAAVSLAAVWVYHRNGLRPFAALLFGLAGQLRPEGHALFALAAADSLLPLIIPGLRKPARFDTRNFALSLLIYGVIAAPYMLFSLSATGRPLPNTFYAKAGAVYFFSFRTLWETAVIHFRDNPVVFILIPVGLFVAARQCRLLAFWLVSLPILTAFILDMTVHHGRYTMPLIPFQMIAGVLGAKWLAERFRGLSRTSIPKTDWRTVCLFGFFMALIFGGAARLPRWAAMLGYNSHEILEIDVALGHWLAENTPPDALIAVDDLGAITFISERRVFDLLGLVSPEMWPVNQNEPFGRPRNEAATRLLSSIQPDYLAIFPTWHWELATNPIVAIPLERFWVGTRTIIANQEAVVYKAAWPYLQEAEPQIRLEAGLGEAIQLLGFDFSPPGTTGPALSVTIYWQSVSAVSENYDVFIHVVDEKGQIVAQADQKPVASLAPTHRWQPGDIVRDPYKIDLPPDLPAGTYRLYTGLYLKDTGLRLPATGPNAGEHGILLTTFQRQP